MAEAAAQTLASGVPPEEIAVLMRSLSLSRPLEAALRRFRVPYTVVGGVGFWERREVKLLLHFLRAATGDTLALAEAIAATVPRFGPKKAQKAAEDPRLLLPVPEGRQLLQAVEDARRIAEARGLALAGETEAWLRRWREFLWPVLLDWAEGNTEAASERYMNTEEVANAMRGFAEHTPQGDLATFLQDILLEMEDGDLEKPQGVRLMTLHASKGLEFHSVFLVGLVEGVFPSWRSAQNPAQLEEERRLHYVGLTRAKENLYLTTYQVGERGPVRPSRFFTETPGQHLPYHPSIGYHGRETTEAVSGLAQIASLDW
ncbi:3'-5' exonuclease [Thermus caldilimi]|uniref:3'-5' exonuclease n=1 Tax=Thermus caldilimi TaxID=2483360 RepID=UPI00142D3857|nr:ATP-dependent helicase [Thermus caldilimi]